MNQPKRKLLFITYCFPPNAESGVHRSLRFVRYLQRLGWSITVLTVDPRFYLPGTPVDTKLLRKVPSNIKIVGTSVFRGWIKAICWRNKIKKSLMRSHSKAEVVEGLSSITKRKPDTVFRKIKDALTVPFSIPDDHVGWFWSGFIKGYREMRASSFDIIYSSAPPWTAHIIGLALAKTGNIPWVADFRDPWARNPWKLDRKGIPQNMANLFERLVVKNGKYVILNTAWAKEEYKGFYKNTDEERFHIIPNGYDPEDFDGINLKKEPHQNGCFHLIHAGALYGGRDPQPMLKGFSLFMQKQHIAKGGLNLSFVGVEDRERGNLWQQVTNLGLQNNVELVNRVSHHDALKRMAQADVLIILQGGTSLCIPAKLYEYMALSKPILGLTPDGATADLIRTYPAGRVVGTEDPAKIATTIELFFNEWKNQTGAKETVAHWDTGAFSAPRLTQKLHELLKKALIQG